VDVAMVLVKALVLVKAGSGLVALALVKGMDLLRSMAPCHQSEASACHCA